MLLGADVGAVFACAALEETPVAADALAIEVPGGTELDDGELDVSLEGVALVDETLGVVLLEDAAAVARLALEPLARAEFAECEGRGQCHSSSLRLDNEDDACVVSRAEALSSEMKKGVSSPSYGYELLSVVRPRKIWSLVDGGAGEGEKR